jgi:hypothetical protein
VGPPLPDDCPAVREPVGVIVITLHLGVIDIPYEDEDTTTGDVAEYLEEKYQIMQTFFDRYSNEIIGFMADDLAAGWRICLLARRRHATRSPKLCLKLTTSLLPFWTTRR